MFPKFANKGAAASPPRMPAAPAAPAAPMARAAAAPLAPPATPLATAATPARPSAPPAPAAPAPPRPAAPLAQNLQAALGSPPARVAGQGFPAFIARGAAAPATPPPAATSPAHLNHLAQSLKSALPTPSAPVRLPMAASKPALPQPAAPPQPPKAPLLAGLRSALPAPQPQLPSMGAARAAQPQKLVAMKSFRDRLARAQANAAQARNAVVLKPAVGQSGPLPPSPGASRPAHRNEPPRAEGPGPGSKLLAVPASRPEPKPMSEGRPAPARATLATPNLPSAVAFKPATPATPATPAARVAPPAMPTALAANSSAQARPTQEATARVEARSDKPSAPAQSRPPLAPSPVSAPSVPLPQAPLGASVPTPAGATPLPNRSEESPRSGCDSSKQSSQKVAALESASARPLLREEMLREVALPQRPLEQPTAPARNSGEGEGQGGGSGQGGGGHHQGGSGGGSGGQGRGQGGEQSTLELDWLGGGDELLAFSSDLRELQLLPRARRHDELEGFERSRRGREEEQPSEQEQDQAPPRQQRRRQWEESPDEGQPVPEDRSDCSPAPLVCRADAEFVAEACRWLERPEIRHYTVICPLDSGSLGIFRLRDFARFESGHLRILG